MLAALLLGVAGLAISDVKLVQMGLFTALPTADATQVNQGIKAFVDQANKTGINGHRISFSETDDRFSVDVFVDQFGKALQDKPLALLSPIGSAAVKRILDDKQLNSAAIVVRNALPGAESFRAPGHPKLFHIRAGDKLQIEKSSVSARPTHLDGVGARDQWLPAMRQPRFEPAVLVRRQASQNVLQIGIRTMALELGALNQTHHRSRSFAGPQ